MAVSFFKWDDLATMVKEDKEMLDFFLYLFPISAILPTELERRGKMLAFNFLLSSLIQKLNNFS